MKEEESKRTQKNYETNRVKDDEEKEIKKQIGNKQKIPFE